MVRAAFCFQRIIKPASRITTAGAKSIDKKDERRKHGRQGKRKSRARNANCVRLGMVDAKGVEPSTSAMRMQHSPN